MDASQIYPHQLNQCFKYQLIRDNLDDKDSLRIRVKPMSDENYFGRSNDMEIVHRGNEIWKFVYIEMPLECNNVETMAYDTQN